MSWLSDNYEKVTLGAAVTALLALVYISMKNKSDQTNAFILPTPRQNEEIEVKEFAAVDKAKVSIYMEHKINQADLDGRKVDLFTGIVLFSQRDDPKNPVDLLKSDPVHIGIPNTWWMENDIDPGYSNSPERDPDGDGFTNREEFDADTDPNESSEYPEPVKKLVVSSVDTLQLHIKPWEASGKGEESFFKIVNKGGDQIVKTVDAIKIGDIIVFKKAKKANTAMLQRRFKFAGLSKRRNPNGVIDTIWIIKDLKPNKKGAEYRFDKRSDLDGYADRSMGIMDTKVTFMLQALEKSDQPFVIEENTYFSLPYDPNAVEKKYLLKEIDRKNKTVTVEYENADGSKNEHVMPYAQ
jgi:hypothetical protein